MLRALHRLHSHTSGPWIGLFMGRDRLLRQAASGYASSLDSMPDWQIPAYLRRRASGDALACPWPPRQ